MIPRPPRSTLFLYTTLFRSGETYCHSTANSTGAAAVVASTGSASFAANELALVASPVPDATGVFFRSEEHTSELQSQSNLVCRLLLEKNNTDDDYLSFSALY